MYFFIAINIATGLKYFTFASNVPTNMPTATLFLDKRTTQKGTDKHPVKVSVYLNPSKQFLTSCNLFATPKDFKAAMTKNGAKTKQQKQLQKQFEETLDRACKILESTECITPDMFKRMFNAQQGIFRSQYRTRLAELYEKKISELKAENRFDSARNYNNSLIALERFKPNVEIEDITEDFLKKWEEHITNKMGLSYETFGTYCRWLRAILNIAVLEKLLHPDRMPFGRNKRTIGTTTSAKTALSLTDLEKFYNYRSTYKTHQRAKDFWFFSYMCNGIGPKDLARLTHKNIQGEHIVWTRIKTKKAKEKVRDAQAYIRPEMRPILQRLSCTDKVYLFDILNSEVDADTNRRRFTTWSRNTNRTLKRIAKILGIRKINLYSARHTFATILRNERVETSQLRDMLNHANERTTENYIGSLPSNILRENSNKLMNFLRPKLTITTSLGNWVIEGAIDVSARKDDLPKDNIQMWIPTK